MVAIRRIQLLIIFFTTSNFRGSLPGKQRRIKVMKFLRQLGKSLSFPSFPRELYFFAFLIKIKEACL